MNKTDAATQRDYRASDKEIKMTTLLIRDREIDWDKNFGRIREICEEAIAESYVRSCLPEVLKGYADKKLSFGWFDSNHTMIKDLTHDFRKIIEYTIKGKCAKDREYAHFYQRIAYEKENTLKILGIDVRILSSFSEIFDKVLEKIKNISED